LLAGCLSRPDLLLLGRRQRQEDLLLHPRLLDGEVRLRVCEGLRR
jgi:hypothetical protein